MKSKKPILREEEFVLIDEEEARRQLEKMEGTVKSEGSGLGGQLSALAELFQKWAEVCKKQSQQEISPELKWYMIGRYHQAYQDADRVRVLDRKMVMHTPVQDREKAEDVKRFCDMFLESISVGNEHS